MRQGLGHSGCGPLTEGARIADAVAESSSRRGFLAGVGAAVMGAAGVHSVGSLVAPGEAEAYHFCGHIYTTDSCPHPTGLPRIDAKGLPIRAADGRPVDDQGRYIDAIGIPVDEDGNVPTDADGTPLPRTSRTPVCAATADVYRLHPARRRRMVRLPAATCASSWTAAARCATASTATRR